MKILLATTPMSADYNDDAKVRPSTGMLYLGSMLGHQRNFNMRELPAEVRIDELNRMTNHERERALTTYGPDVVCVTPYEMNWKEVREYFDMVSETASGALKKLAIIKWILCFQEAAQTEPAVIADFHHPCLTES